MMRKVTGIHAAFAAAVLVTGLGVGVANAESDNELPTTTVDATTSEQATPTETAPQEPTDGETTSEIPTSPEAPTSSEAPTSESEPPQESTTPSLPTTTAGAPVGQQYNGTLVKKDRLTGAPLAGATFDVMNCHQVYEDPSQRVTTGADGTVAVSLPVSGCHKAVEITAPAGYTLDPTEVYFDVSDAPFQVSILDTPVGYTPVARDPGHRVPISSIPSGPVAQA